MPVEEAGSGPPPIEGILETALYYPPELEGELERFYGRLLGMRSIGRSEGKFLFFRAGSSVFLLFNLRASRSQTSPPPHGAEGPGHTCFVVPSERYDLWKRYLSRVGVEPYGEMSWPRSGRSFYFDDPAGNVLEIADRDIWPP